MLNEYLLCEVLTKTKFKVFAFSLMIVVLEWIKHFLSKKAGTVNAKIQTVYFGKLGISKMGDGSPSGEMALKAISKVESTDPQDGNSCKK